MKPQSLMNEERVLQPPPEIKPRSKTKPQLPIKCQKLKMDQSDQFPPHQAVPRLKVSIRY